MKWLRQLFCFHMWRPYVMVFPKKGEPHTWRQCMCCDKIKVTLRATYDHE